MGNEPTRREQADTAARRLARRLGLGEEDVLEPDAVADLVYRVEYGPRVGFPRAPLRPYPLEGPPDLGEEPLQRYPLEKDTPPAMGQVSWETDVALDLGEDLHESSRGKRDGKGKTRGS